MATVLGQLVVKLEGRRMGHDPTGFGLCLGEGAPDPCTVMLCCRGFNPRRLLDYFELLYHSIDISAIPVHP